MNYLTPRINSDYLIKAYGVTDGKRVNTLLGVSGLVNMVGKELANKFLERAYESEEYKTICKLRRGLKITFYMK